MRTVRAALIAAWPFLASLALGVVIVASIISVGVTWSQREEYRRQSVAVENLLIRQEKADAAARTRLTVAVAEIDRITTERFATHDEAAREAHRLEIEQIARLLGRPAGVRLDPVAATVATTTTRPSSTTTTSTTTAVPCRAKKKC